MIPFCYQDYLPVFFGITLIMVSVGLMVYTVIGRAESVPPSEAA